jgi:hypothetical protein
MIKYIKLAGAGVSEEKQVENSVIPSIRTFFT